MNLLVPPGDDIGPEITAAALAVPANPAQRTTNLCGTTGTRACGAAVVAQLEESAERPAQNA